MKINDIRELENKNFIDIGRASDLLWLQFGEKIKIKNYKNIEIERGSMGLNIQCPWRILKRDQLILGNNDIYEPADDIFETEFDWSEIGGSVFDKKVIEIFSNMLPLMVKSVEVSKIGDLKLEFEKEIVLEVISNSASKIELWRFINYKTNEHIVCFE